MLLEVARPARRLRPHPRAARRQPRRRGGRDRRPGRPQRRGQEHAARTIAGVHPAGARQRSASRAARSTGRPVEALVRQGIVLVPEGRGTLRHLTVRENLRLGGLCAARRAAIDGDLDRVLRRFPACGERLGQKAGTLSGGEQQMLAIGRALMARPRLLLLDEPSLGLAPVVVREIFEHRSRELNARGRDVLLVEQNARQALQLAHRAYVLETGRWCWRAPTCCRRARARGLSGSLRRVPCRNTRSSRTPWPT